MQNNKCKMLTFSYDDGVTQDVRLISLLNKYGIKGTFNINSELLGLEGHLVREGVHINHTKVNASDVRNIYEGHEIAAHTLTHPFLPDIEDDAEIIRQVEYDRLRLSELAGYEVVGFAYPGGGTNFNRRVADVIKRGTGIKYCRTTVSSYGFDPEPDLFCFRPSLYHHGDWEKLYSYAEEFVNLRCQTQKMLYIWGHAYEFDINNSWERFEELLRFLSGREDIFYGTNRECILDSNYTKEI